MTDSITWATLVHSAFEIGQEGRLNDPSDDNILIYSAEWTGHPVDLTTLSEGEVSDILHAYALGEAAA